MEGSHSKLAEQKRELIFTRDFYGLGWNIGTYRDQKQLHHFGGYPGYATHVSFMPRKGIGVGILFNSGNIAHEAQIILAQFVYDWWLDSESASKEFKKSLKKGKKLEKRMWKGIMADRKKRAKRTWQLELPGKAYAGTYVAEDYGTVTVEFLDGKHTIKMGNLSAIADPFPYPNTTRVELVPGSGRVAQFKVEDGLVSTLYHDGIFFKRAEWRESD
jgi:hypothetical protein